MERKSLGKDFLEQVKLLLEMLKCHLRGEYKGLSNQSLLMIVFGLLYFVIPTDLVPDFVPLGFLDDASILLGVMKSLSADIDSFKQWKESTAAIGIVES